jgi:hypothetical protein
VADRRLFNGPSRTVIATHVENKFSFIEWESAFRPLPLFPFGHRFIERYFFLIMEFYFWPVKTKGRNSSKARRHTIH